MKKKYILGSVLVFVLSNALAHESGENMQSLNASYNLINLQNAYKNNPNITGTGVSVGILDSSFNEFHPSLLGKMIESQNNYDFDTPRIQNVETMRHGTHVAGILLGADLNDTNTPRGVAYGAKFYGVGVANVVNGVYRGDLYAFLGDANKNVKVINASITRKYFPIINRVIEQGDVGASNYRALLNSPSMADKTQWVENFTNNDSMLRDMKRLAQSGILNVVGAGNDGVSAPSVLASLPSFDEDLRAWLVVGALNANGIEKNSSGALTIKNSCNSGGGICLANFSNGFVGAENYALMAPGVNIDSANAHYAEALPNMTPSDVAFIKASAVTKKGREFISATGTSQATPMVSGAAALVAQKYPFLNGAQIADTLLSTANKDYKTQKVYVKEVLDTDPNDFSARNSYNIIYIKDKDKPNPIPMKDGKIDMDQVKKDLTEVGYTTTNSPNIDFIIQNVVDKATTNPGEYEGIIALSKEQMFGQGILDVAKALDGLSILDANRLRIADVASFEGQSYGFYTLNVSDPNNQTFEFKNDISQKKWDDNLHLSGAKNSPRNLLLNKDIGLIKTGNATLILSGNNTYSAPTISRGGILKIKGNGNFGSGATGADSLNDSAKGALINSKGYALNSGILELENAYLKNGAIAQSGGVVLISKNARVDREVLAKNGGEIRVSENSNLFLSNSTNRTNMNLVLQNSGILSGGGVVYGNVLNTSGELWAGFDRVLNKLEDSKNYVLKIEGTYIQEPSAKLLIAFDGSNDASLNNTKNTNLSATSLDIRGGELVYRPIFLSASKDSSIKPGQVLKMSLDQKILDNLDKFSIRAQGTNTLDFNLSADKLTLNAVQKSNAFGSDSQGMALSQIFNASNLPQRYDEFFGNIGVNLDAKEYQESLDSIKSDAALGSAEYSFNEMFSKNIIQLNMINAPLNTFNLPTKVAFNDVSRSNNLASDAFFGQFLEKNKSEFSLNINTSKLKHNLYNTNTTGSGFVFKTLLNDDLSLGIFFDYDRISTSAKYADSKQNRLSLGLGSVYNLGTFELFGIGNFGVGKNKTKRQIFGAPSELNGSFNSYLLNLQVGVAKELGEILGLSNFSVRPSFALSHMLLKQDGFKESGGDLLFARSYNAQSNNSTSAILGGSVGSGFDFKSTRINLGVFGFYSMRLSSKLKSDAIYSDFEAQKFSTDKTLGNSVFFGTNASLFYDRYFVNLSLNNEKNKDYSWFSTKLNLGFKF